MNVSDNSWFKVTFSGRLLDNLIQHIKVNKSPLVIKFSVVYRHAVSLLG